jgi:hypothetical protein
MALSLAELGAFAEGLVDVSDTIPIAQAAHDVFSLLVPCGPRATSTCCVATSPMPCPCWPRVSRSARPAKYIFCSPE